MVFTPEQYRKIAERYDSIAGDHMLPPAQRQGFAHKADWYRTLARLGDRPTWAMPENKIIPDLMSSQAEEKKRDPIPSLLAAALRGLLAWQKRW
jgi:hypothetical protein